MPLRPPYALDCCLRYMSPKADNITEAVSQDQGESNLRKYVAEAIGIFWLTFAGCGSAVIAAGFPNVGIGLRRCPSPSA